MERLTIHGNDGKAYIRALDPDCTCNQTCPRLWDHMWMLADRLAAYEDADEAGRLTLLPCKVGDAAYWVHSGIITGCRVYRIQLNRAGLFICLRSKVSHGAFSARCIGKTVFFSRREAEAALGGADKEEISICTSTGQECSMCQPGPCESRKGGDPCQ